MNIPKSNYSDLFGGGAGVALALALWPLFDGKPVNAHALAVSVIYLIALIVVWAFRWGRVQQQNDLES